MNLGQRVLDSGLITQDNSAGIIEEATVKAVDLPDLPENVRVEGTETDLQTSAPLGEAVETLQSEPTSSALGNFGDPFEDTAQKVREEQDKNLGVTYLDTVKASIENWDVVGLWEESQNMSVISANEAGLYTPDPEFDINESLKTVEIPLSLEEVKWLGSKGISSEGELGVYLDSIKEKRERQQVASKSPITNFTLGILDPTYIPLGLGAGKLAQLGGLGRFGTATMVGATELSLIKAQEIHRPVSNFELALGAVLPTAITLGVYRVPKVHQQLNGVRSVGEEGVVGKSLIRETEVDALTGKVGFSNKTKTTVDHLDNIDAVNASRNTPLTDDPTLITPAKQVDTDGTVKPYKTNEYGMPRADQLDWKATNSRGVAHENTAYKWVYDILEDGKVPKSIRDSTARLMKQAGRQLAELEVKFNTKMRPQGRFNIATNTIELKSIKGKRVNAQTLNHEIVHGLTSIRIMYGKAKPDSVHGQLVKDIDDLRSHVTKEYNSSKDKYSKAEQKEIEYALQDTDEFLAGLYEGNTAFHRMMSEFETPANIRQGGEKTLLQSLYNGFRKLFGLTNEESRALNKALKLSEDLIDTPTIRYTDINGKERVFRASEVTPKLIEEVSGEEAQTIFKHLAGKAGEGMEWSLRKTIRKASPEASRVLYDGVVPDKVYFANSLGVNRVNAEQMFNKELSARGVSKWGRAWNTAKNREESAALNLEIAMYKERRSQAQLRGEELPVEDSPVARIAEEYGKLTNSARDIGIREGLFDAGLADTSHYLPRKIDPVKFGNVYAQFEEVFGVDKAKAEFIDYLSETFRFEAGGKEYSRYIAQVYFKRMHDSLYRLDDAFRGHLGDGVTRDVKEVLTGYGVTDKKVLDKVEELMTNAIDSRGEASFQKARLNIDTLKIQRLPDGTEFRFFDMMNTDTVDLYSRYTDTISGRLALARHGLGTPTLRQGLKREVTGSPFLQGKADLTDRYSKLIDNTFNSVLGYPVGEALHPFFVAFRAFTTMVSLRNSGIWQVMEIVPTFKRHAEVNGFGKTLKESLGVWFTSTTKIETKEAGRLSTLLLRSSMDDLKISPLVTRLNDNHTIDGNILASKLTQLSKYTHVLNGMRWVMGKQAIMASRLIEDTVAQSVKGNPKAKALLKRYGFDDYDFRVMEAEWKAHGNDVASWGMDSRAKTIPKLIKLMDTDVLRSRTGDIPAIMEFSQVGKVIGTYRNFIVTAHNKIFASTLKHEGVLAVALITAYQLPLAMLSVQVANLARGEGLIEDPVDLFHKAFLQLGGLGFLPEIVGILTGGTNNFGSPATMGVDRLVRLGNAVGSGDFYDMVSGASAVIPLWAITAGAQAGVDSVLQTIKESMEE